VAAIQRACGERQDRPTVRTWCYIDTERLFEHCGRSRIAPEGIETRP